MGKLAGRSDGWISCPVPLLFLFVLLSALSACLAAPQLKILDHGDAGDLQMAVDMIKDDYNCLAEAVFSSDFALPSNVGRRSRLTDLNLDALAVLRPHLTNSNLQANLLQVRCDLREIRPVRGIVYLPPVGKRPVAAGAVESYKPNFGLPKAWDDLPHRDKVISKTGDLEVVDRAEPEIKFQFSFNAVLVADSWYSRFPLYFAYTQKSFWQAYHTERSRPFRENNYNPELFLDYSRDPKLTNKRYGVILGLAEHESNGQIELFSRGWSRSYLQPYFVTDRSFMFIDGAFLSFKIWNRWDENPETDDNPDLAVG